MRLTWVFVGILSFAGCGGDKTVILLGTGGPNGGCEPGHFRSTNGECIPDGTCREDTDCEGADVCSATHVCTDDEAPRPCADDAECHEGEICSVNELCIDEGQCFDDPDCRTDGQVCTPRNVCLPEGTCEQNGDCPEGYVCTDGACVIGGECGENSFEIDVAPNLLILLDRSGSMNELIDGRSKWDIAVEAVSTNIDDYDGAIRFGLALFSNCEAGGSCAPGAVEVACAAGATPDIIARLGAAPRCSSTPIAASLNAMLGEPSIQDPARDNAILLVTDGEDSCGGDSPPEAAALLAQAIPVPTYVVGFGGGVDAAELAGVANAGGTALAADPVYYQADDAGGLAAALADIAARVLGCSFVLDVPPPGDPPDPSLVTVFFNGGEEIAEDAAEGWTYDAATNTITFNGGSCARLESGEIVDIDVVYGCPDDVG